MARSSGHLSVNDRLFMALTAVVMFAPLPLASNRPWSWNLLAVAVGLIACLWAVATLRGVARPGMPLRRLALPAALFAVALLWGVVQSLPIAPAGWSHPVWQVVATETGKPLQAFISADPEKTVDALIRLTAYGLAFGLATQLGRRRHRVMAGLTAVAAAGVFYALMALTYYYLGLEFILWMPKWAYHGDATGTFVGRASFGAFVGVIALIALTLSVQRRLRGMPVIGASDHLERLLSRTVPWLAGVSVAVVAILASHSRGALLVTVFGAVVLLVALACNGQIRKKGAVLLFVLLSLIFGAGLAVAGDVVLARLAGEGDLTGDRPNLLRLTWSAISDSPWLGHGLGAFEAAFLPYRDPSLPRDVLYDYAHNTWAEVIMDLGWIAGGSLLLSVIIPTAVCTYGLFRRPGLQVAPAVAVAVAALLGAHAMIDFSVQMPAVALLFAYVLGLGYGQALRTDAGSDGDG